MKSEDLNEIEDKTLSSIFGEGVKVNSEVVMPEKKIKIENAKAKKKNSIDIEKLMQNNVNRNFKTPLNNQNETNSRDDQDSPDSFELAETDNLKTNKYEENEMKFIETENKINIKQDISIDDIFSDITPDYKDKQIVVYENDKDSSMDYLNKVADNYNRFWSVIEQILRIAGSDTDVQKIASDLVLTREKNIDDQQNLSLSSSLTNKLIANGFILPNSEDVKPILSMVYDEMIGISVIGALWRDDDITEIMVDRWDRITIEKNGRLILTPLKFRSQSHAESIARSLANRVSDRALSNTIPLVTSELPGARITFAYGQVVKGGISITLRKFRTLLTTNDLIKRNSISKEMIDFLKDAVTSRAGILVSGGTGTGKTTIINMLSSFIPDNERVVTIEDAFELQISATHVVSLQTKEASSRDDQISITMADLMINTLRMRPDRIIVGEIREGKGANVMLTAANTGHDGTMTTIHASSAELALNERLVDLVREERNSSDDAIKRTIVSAFDLVVQVTRGRRGQRYISEIALVDRSIIKEGSIKPYPLFLGYEDEKGEIHHERANKLLGGTILSNKMIDSGIDSEKWG